MSFRHVIKFNLVTLTIAFLYVTILIILGKPDLKLLHQTGFEKGSIRLERV